MEHQRSGPSRREYELCQSYADQRVRADHGIHCQALLHLIDSFLNPDDTGSSIPIDDLDLITAVISNCPTVRKLYETDAVQYLPCFSSFNKISQMEG